MDGYYTVVVVDGDAADLTDIYTDSVRYDGLTWADSIELARLSFTQGFEIVIWKQSNDVQDGGAEACGTA